MFELPETRVLVCGGRKYGIDQYTRWHDSYAEKDTYKLLDEVDVLLHIGTIIQGGGGYADQMAAKWAQLRRIVCVSWPAQWKKHGDAAGPIRNGEMLKAEPQLVIALPGGVGTANMALQAEQAGIPVYRHRQSGRFELPANFAGAHKP